MYDCNKLTLQIPGTGDCLYPGSRIQLGRFTTNEWVVNYGWYTCDGNREVCGWYLVDCHNCNVIKPLSRPDIYDIIILQR